LTVRWKRELKKLGGNVDCVVGDGSDTGGSEGEGNGDGEYAMGTAPSPIGRRDGNCDGERN